MDYQNILIKQNDGVLVITINRPRNLNALNHSTIFELNHAFLDAEKNRNIKCLILTGTGKQSFIAGADIKEFSTFNQKKGLELSKNGHRILFDLLENLSKPSIAAINGYALGGGLELALSCSFRIASENSMMGMPEVTLGLIPGYGGTQRLPNIVGKGQALEMILTGKMISAKKAKEIRLINHVTNQEELLLKAEQLALTIVKNSPSAISKAIQCVNVGVKNIEKGFQEEQKQFGKCFDTEDFKEGISAFLEKRKPDFN